MSAPIESDWELLSESSRRALLFASAAAQERTALEKSRAEIDCWDLLVGILLSHPGQSEAELTFSHFGLVAGQALPDGYPQLTADGLNNQLAQMSPDENPVLSEEAGAVIREAIGFGRAASADGVAELRSLWAALLQGPNRASSQLQNLLLRRGVDASRFTSETREWVERGGQPPFEAFLEDFRVGPVDVINFKADQVVRDARSRELPANDFVGISAEVDAFAYLIAANTLEPPLAIGLFGDWGSGKSYFMNSIRRRIEQLTESEEIRLKDQRTIPFWKRIVQVDFNAWHYVDGDLWSSLVDHIFTQLNLASERTTDNEVERRRRYYLAQLEITSETLKGLEEKKKKVERELEDHQNKKALVEQQYSQAQNELAQARATRIVDARISSSKQAVAGALRSVQLSSGAESLTIGEALDSLAAAHAELQRGSSLVREVLTDRDLALKLLFFVALAVIVPFGIEKVTASAIVAASAGIASLLAVAVKALTSASQLVKGQLDEIDRATQKVNQEREAAESQWRDQLAQAAKRVQETSVELEAVEKQESQLKEQVNTIALELAKGPSQVLYEFLQGRLEAGEYRKRLGVPAIIRRDFNSLADLISDQNRFLLTPAEQKEQIRDKSDKELLEEDDPLIINRIVLYIDDLDRCDDAKVIDVLQAVHLLLAFPLFVVIVAVDSRWLAHALQSHYPALAGFPSLDRKAAAQPEDYLEKIFQVPFWVQDLDCASRGRIVHGLLGAHVRVESRAGGVQNDNNVRVGDEEAKVLKVMLEPRNGPPLLDAKALTVTRDELAFLDRLTPLMGDTPRSIKRFVNVYQLVKLLRSSRTPTEGGPPSDDEIAAFLLAVAEGLPGLGWTLINVAANKPALTLSSILNSPDFAACQAERDRLNVWLENDDNVNWRLVASERLAAIALDVRRFLFQRAPLPA